MRMNIYFTFPLFLISLVVLNVYFFYTLSNFGRNSNVFLPNIQEDSTTYKEIYGHLNRLPNQYKQTNIHFLPLKTKLLKSFNTSGNVENSIWQNNNDLSGEEGSLFPFREGTLGHVLHAMQNTKIVLVDNAPKGTQLKLLLLFKDNQKLFFKPKRYDLNHIIKGNIYAGFDRHNSEVFSYYLALIMGFTWIAPSVIRKLNLESEILPVATLGLRKTMIRKDYDTLCIYGKCFYCRVNETVCPDKNGEIEGAAILYLDKSFQVYKSPWRRSYTSKKMEWEIDNNYCTKVRKTHSVSRILNLVDVAIFDFLIQNGDRHRYEVYKERVVLLDNGKGLGNPTIDEMDILAPLYQCCVLSSSTWQHLELLSGGVLSNTLKSLASLQKQQIATEDHFKAVERRLLKVYATIQYCIGKYGRTKVIKNDTY